VLTAIDLNLLLIFEAILKEGSVSRAADRLNLTQSAVSHSLARLRGLMNDPLFVRGRRGMEPTVFAESIGTRVTDVLDEVRNIFTPEREFDPGESRRRFTMGMTDYLGFVIMPPLAERLSAAAPHVRMVTLPTHAHACTPLLERGELDLYVGRVPPDAPTYLASSPLYKDELICVARADHPAFRKKLNREGFLAQAHLNISPWGAPGYVDDRLASHAARRRIALSVGDFLVAPAILERSDLIAVLPRRIAEPMQKRFALALQASPFDFGESEIGLTWHRRLDGDPGLAWLKDQIALACHADGATTRKKEIR
jgi:DNA-binding transcriptional LysR family regulator